MHDVLAKHVERGIAPGIVTLISRRGEVHVEQPPPAIGPYALDGEGGETQACIGLLSPRLRPVVFKQKP